MPERRHRWIWRPRSPTCADLFTRHGGHAGAAGFELAGRRAGPSSSSGSRRSPRPASRRIRGPCSRSISPCPRSTSITGCSASSAGSRPYGPGNPEPLVAVLGLTVTRVRVAADDHTSLTLKRDRDVLDGIAFGRADIAALVQEGDRIDVVARISSRTFGGFESLQLEIRDAAPSGSHPEAAAVLGGSDPADARGGAVMTRAVRPRSAKARDPYGIGPVGSAIGPIVSVVGLIADRGRHDQPVQLRAAVRGGSGGNGERRWRHRRPGADAGPLERGRRAGGGAVRRQDRLRQGRQHLGADRRRARRSSRMAAAPRCRRSRPTATGSTTSMTR